MGHFRLVLEPTLETLRVCTKKECVAYGFTEIFIFYFFSFYDLSVWIAQLEQHAYSSKPGFTDGAKTKPFSLHFVLTVLTVLY